MTDRHIAKVTMRISKLPSGWKIFRFSDVVEIAKGQVSPLDDRYSNFPHIGPKNIQSNTGQIIKIKTPDELGLISGKYLFDKNSIVYSKIRPNLNKVCLPGYEGLCSADAYPIWAKKNIDINYLFIYMLSEMFVKQAIAVSMRTGMPKINREDLRAVWVIVPDKNEQKCIANTVLKWSMVINLYQKLIREKNLLRKGLMQQLLSGKRRFPEFGKPKEEGERAPKDWALPKTEEVFKNCSTKNYPEEVILSVTQDQGVIPRNALTRRINADKSNTATYKLVQPGDFVISLRSFQGGLEYSNYRGLVSPAYHVIRPKVEISTDYYRHYFKSSEFIKRLAVAVIGIRDGKQISYSDFSFMRIPVPGLEEQNKISETLNKADEEITLLQKNLEALKLQKKGLMQQLLTGKKRVKVMDVA